MAGEPEGSSRLLGKEAVRVSLQVGNSVWLHGQVNHKMPGTLGSPSPKQDPNDHIRPGCQQFLHYACQSEYDPSQSALHYYFPDYEWHGQHGDGVFQVLLPTLGAHLIPGYYLLIAWLGSQPTLSSASAAGRVNWGLRLHLSITCYTKGVLRAPSWLWRWGRVVGEGEVGSLCSNLRAGEVPTVGHRIWGSERKLRDKEVKRLAQDHYLSPFRML